MGVVSSPPSLVRVRGCPEERLGQGLLVVGGDEPAGARGDDLGGPVRVGGDHRQPAGHRLHEDEPERLGDRGQHEQVGGVQGVRQLVMRAPAGEEDLLVADRPGDRERVLAFPLAGAAAHQHQRQRPAELLKRLRVRPDQEWQPLDGGVTADVEHDRLGLLERPQVGLGIGDSARGATFVPAERLLDEPAPPVREPLAAVERSAPEQVELDPARKLDDRCARDTEQLRDLARRRRRDDQPYAATRPVAHPLPPALREAPSARRARVDRAHHGQLGAVQLTDHRHRRECASRGLVRQAGATHPAARVSARLAEILWADKGRIEQGIENMERAFDVLSAEEPDEDLAALAAQLGRFHFFHGEADLAGRRIERALELAEAVGAPEILSEALNTKAIILAGRGRRHEALALLPYARDLALEHEKPSAALRAFYNLADTLCHVDRYEEAAAAVREGLALARRVGARWWEWQFLGQLYPLFSLGAWDEIEAMIAQLPEERWSEIRTAWPGILTFGTTLRSFRGNPADAETLLERCAEMETSADVQEHDSFHLGRANLLLMSGDTLPALESAELAFASRESMGTTQEYSKQAFVTACEAALALDELAKAEELLCVIEALPPGSSSQFLQAHVARFRAHLYGRRGEVAEADPRFKRAAALFRELALVFYLAVTQLEHAGWLWEQGRAAEAEPLLGEAREIFERLGATPWLGRLDAVGARARTGIAT